MVDKIESQKIVSEGGLNTLNNYLTLSSIAPGSAVRLQNFESSLAGGYRRVSGYRLFDTDFGEVGAGVAEGPVLGIWGFYNTTTRTQMYIAARKTIGVTQYKFYSYTLGVGWTAMVTGTTQNSQTTFAEVLVKRVRAEVFNHGTGNQIIFVDGVNKALVYNGTSWFDIDPASAGGSGAEGGNQALTYPSIVTSFRNHVFMSGDYLSPGVVAHSAPEDITTWTSAAGGGQIIYGYDVVQIKPFRDALFAFGSRNIKKIVVDDTGAFIIQDVTSDLGCVARDSVLEIGGSLIFLSHDGIRPVAGTDRLNDVELGLLSQPIQNIIDEISINFDLTYLNGLVIRNKTQFRYFISNDAYTQASGYGLLGSVRMIPQAQSSGSRWEFSTLYGIRASCCWSGIVGTAELVLHGDYDGKVYRQESGNDFNGADITAIYSTPYLDISDTEVRKTLRELNIFLKAEGTFDLNISVRYDWGASTVVNPANYVGQVNGAAVYDDSATLYDAAFYGGEARSVFSQNIQGSCRSVQYTFSTTDQSAPYTIHGFVHEFSYNGRQ